MTYFRPDDFNTVVIKWTMRLTLMFTAIAVISTAASLAFRAVMLLGGTLLTFIHPLITAVATADPLIQLSLELIAFLVLLGIAIKLFMAIMASQVLERGIA